MVSVDDLEGSTRVEQISIWIQCCLLIYDDPNFIAPNKQPMTA